jgi:Zn-dependent protease
MGPRPLFRLFGIPVSIDPWFLVGLFLFYSLSGGGTTGIYTACALAVFVLIHEMGHALVARRFGADVSITLNFLIGWTGYSRRKPLTRAQSNIISLSGPLTQLVVAALALWGVEEWVTGNVEAYLVFAIIWSGLVLAVLNLLPLWPLDGGHIVDSLIDSKVGLAGRRVFFGWSMVASVVMVAFSITESAPEVRLDNWAGGQLNLAANSNVLSAIGHVIIATPAIAMTSAGFFIAIFCGLNSWGAYHAATATLQGGGEVRVDPRAIIDEQTLSQVRSAERQGWSFGTPGEFPRGYVASPWLQAHLVLTAGGSVEDASQQLLGLAAPRQNWVVDRYDRPEIGRLLEYVPPMVANTPAVVAARVYQGSSEQLISAALNAYHGDVSAEGFYLIAEGLAQRHDLDEAMSWLVRAVQEHPNPRRVALSRPLNALHGRSDFQQLLGVAERAVAPEPRR